MLIRMIAGLAAEGSKLKAVMIALAYLETQPMASSFG